MKERDHRYWVIYRKFDDAIMPMPLKRGGFIGCFSRTEFDGFQASLSVPRLFTSEASARAALTAWCRGIFQGGSEELPHVSKHGSTLGRECHQYGICLIKLQLL